MPAASVPRVPDPGRLIAHRGASQVAPENTLEAFRAAESQGVYWIEFDVMLLGDGTPVIHHDETLDRCTNATGPLADINLGDLGRISAGRGFGDHFRHCRVPTLEQTLDLIEELSLYANLELKIHGPATGELASTVAAALSRRAWASERIVVSCFDHGELAFFRDVAPTQPIALLYKQISGDWREASGQLAVAALHTHYTGLSSSLIRAIADEGLDVRVYTLNDPALGEPLRDAGLTSVITDHPPIFLQDPAWHRWALGQRPADDHPA